MSAEIQPFFADLIDRPVVMVKMEEQVPDWELAMHQHQKNQFVVTTRGLVTIETARGIWVVPPNSAIWIAANTQHQVKSYGYSSGYVLFVEHIEAFATQEHIQMYHCSSFLKALLQRIESVEYHYHQASDQCLMQCLLDEIAVAVPQSFCLRMPEASRLKKITQHLLQHPADHYTLKQWAEVCCMSERSMTRAFLAATGLSINQWRIKLHSILALQWLMEGDTVQQIAYRLGYDSDASFIVSFKKVMQVSPKKYLKQSATPQLAVAS
ncbi:helix-turn-helix domain-containing protein [Acinetobacter larvae]|uniref:AraC family transcriptional regulator n=1 Tax=Acinetobacter larvae TaxID=1789224 RepID=A0A1B2LXK1_9GAMM|nr:AraC family transcriptional regulator [Acinetobacter larvae]AOA57692.1 AraC family transcriptional regulator [Acinetobacter larvae]